MTTPWPERIAQREEQAARKLVEAAVGDAEANPAVPSEPRPRIGGDQHGQERVHQDDKRDRDVPENLAGDLLVHFDSVELRASGRHGGVRTGDLYQS